MKKFTIVVGVFCASLSSKAQNIFPSSGNVGIGTSGPLYPLHINASNQVYMMIRTTNYTLNPTVLTKKGGIIFNQENVDKTAGISFAIPPGYHVPGIVFSTKTSYSTPGTGVTDWYDRLFIHPNGNIGIGTTAPIYNVQIDAADKSYLMIRAANYTLNPAVLTKKGGIIFDQENTDKTAAISFAIPPGFHVPGIVFSTKNSFSDPGPGTEDWYDRMFIHPAGNVGIGTINPTEKLSVNGNILAKKVRVSQSWADDVFDSTYRLRPLEEVHAYVQDKRHLPDMPSAKEIENNGLDLGEIVKQQQVKIEELTLYLIELKKVNDEQKKQIELLTSKVEKWSGASVK
jgi:uncharacterized coiled-coil protein SlyX